MQEKITWKGLGGLNWEINIKEEKGEIKGQGQAGKRGLKLEEWLKWRKVGKEKERVGKKDKETAKTEMEEKEQEKW